ncbi:MAG: HAMP domain-containing histidine kinase, partial [Deltaproteobacteria bacterium]|nr:HAMP domain-containing histidine kinase [Deltaproteobacteria bacterium]
MRLTAILLFLLTVLVPTAFLSYFSLQAVRGEKAILENHLRQKYQSMAQVVLGEIETALKGIAEDQRADPAVLEPLFLKQTHLFKDEVMIFDHRGRAVDGQQRKDFGTPVYLTKMTRFPYEIAVYDRQPFFLHQVESIKQRIALHIGIVGLCAVAILCGGLLTLRQLHREWGRTETKGEFISHLAHDLKRPLTSIRMFSEMLVTGRIPSEEKRKEYHRILLEESEKLIHLIHNVLDFSRIEGRKKRYDMRPENFAHMVRDTIERFQTYVENRTHVVRLDIVDGPSSPNVNVCMDAEAISQALMNCLFNAAKYSPPGSEVRVVV